MSKSALVGAPEPERTLLASVCDRGVCVQKPTDDSHVQWPPGAQQRKYKDITGMSVLHQRPLTAASFGILCAKCASLIFFCNHFLLFKELPK